MYFEQKLEKNIWWKFHQILIPGAFFSMLFSVIGCIDWDVAGIYQKTIEHNGTTLNSLITIDKYIPIISPLIVIYLTAVGSWVLFPFIIYLVYGKEKYAKTLGVSVFLFIVSLTIKLSFPVSTGTVEQYGVEVLKQKVADGTATFFDKSIITLLESGFYYSGFPSNHCSEQLLLFIAIVDFNFFSRRNKYDPFQKQGYMNNSNLPLRIFLTILVAIYTVLVCASTFILKVHYFVDWIPSLCLTLFFWIVLSIFRKINIFQRLFLKFMVNYSAGFGYESNVNNEYLAKITWANKMFTEEKISKYTKKEFAIHYVWVDILTLAIVAVLGVFTSGFVLKLF